MEIAALAGLVVFAVIVTGFAIALSSERLARRVGDRAASLVSAAGRLLHKAPVKWNGASFVRFRDESIELIRRRWLFLTAATLAGHLTVFVVLSVSLRAVGVTHAEVTIVEVMRLPYPATVPSLPAPMTPAAGPHSTICAGRSTTASADRMPPEDCITFRRPFRAAFLELLDQREQIGLHRRADIGVDHGRAGAFVFLICGSTSIDSEMKQPGSASRSISPMRRS